DAGLSTLVEVRAVDLDRVSLTRDVDICGQRADRRTGHLLPLVRTDVAVLPMRAGDVEVVLGRAIRAGPVIDGRTPGCQLLRVGGAAVVGERAELGIAAGAPATRGVAEQVVPAGAPEPMGSRGEDVAAGAVGWVPAGDDW